MVVTWSPIYKRPGVVLSSDKLTATGYDDNASSFQSGRATLGVQPGEKKIWRIHLTAEPDSAASYQQMGVCSDTYPLDGSTYMILSQGAGSFGSDPFFWAAGDNKGSVTSRVLGDFVDYAVDNTVAKLMWQRINSGPWNAGGGANPATGVGGYSIAGITGGQSPAIIYPGYILVGGHIAVGQVVGIFVQSFSVAGFTALDPGTPRRSFVGAGSLAHRKVRRTYPNVYRNFEPQPKRAAEPVPIPEAAPVPIPAAMPKPLIEGMPNPRLAPALLLQPVPASLEPVLLPSPVPPTPPRKKTRRRAPLPAPPPAEKLIPLLPIMSMNDHVTLANQLEQLDNDEAAEVLLTH